ncbi:hypothetical protein [Dactylosporangium sp. CA-139066]|uniref:hypothetical protein n=1 Tax=Dactylosporangium sp. CA-139066 TaxID=3239930 RepID=UPI003D91D5C5
MGRHERRRRTVCVVRDPRRVALALRPLRADRAEPRAGWWVWLVPLCGLVLWPLAPAAAFLVAVALVFGVGGLVRYRMGSGIRLEGDAARDWVRAASLLREIRRGWRGLGGMAEPADIRPTLALTGYHLAKLISARARMAAYAQELRAARAGLAPGELRDEADERAEVAEERARELGAQFAARVEALGRLASSLRGHERAERVRALLAAGPPAVEEPGADPIAEVEGRTAVVLAAYEELSGLRPSPSETRS